MPRRSADRASLVSWLLTVLCVLLAVALWLEPRTRRPAPSEPEVSRGGREPERPAPGPDPAVGGAPQGASGALTDPSAGAGSSVDGVAAGSPTVVAVPVAPPTEAAGETAAGPRVASSGPKAAARSARSPVREPAPRIAILIDDAGHNLQELAPYLALEAPISVAVLPGLAHSAEAARRVRAAGKEAVLHLPMQPLGDDDPGPGAIRTGMSATAIRASVDASLEEVGPVVAINNHMGSLATADARTVRDVLQVGLGRSLIFVDSRTTALSVVEREARALGVPALSRDVFLDNEPTAEEHARRLEEGRRIARQRGHALLVGHVQTPGLAAFLARAIPELRAKGYEVVAVSGLARGVNGGGGR